MGGSEGEGRLTLNTQAAEVVTREEGVLCLIITLMLLQ
jgi:hypothetical protein